MSGSHPQGILTIVPTEGGIYLLMDQCLFIVTVLSPLEDSLYNFKLSLVLFLTDIVHFSTLLSPSVSVTKSS